MTVDNPMLAALQRYLAKNPPPSEEELERRVDAEFKKVTEEQERAEMERHPSLKHIPRFFEKRRPPEDSLLHRVRKEARQRFLQLRTVDLIEEGDLHALLGKLRERATARAATGELETIDFESFFKVRADLPAKLSGYFTASTFLKFDRDPYGCIPILPFFNYVVRSANVQQVRIQISFYDSGGYGFLTEKDLENYIYELLPQLPHLQSLQEEFYPFYVFTAVRKFFFFLDAKRTGRIPIRDLLASPIMAEMFEMRSESPLSDHDALANWFSVPSALKIYGTYLDLDADQNGMLNRAELQNYGHRMLTPAFVERVFQEVLAYDGEIDYKGYLDFTLAMENKKTPQAMRYLWQFLDLRKQGYLDAFTIQYFFRDVVALLRAKNLEAVSSLDVQDEIFDMVKPKDPLRITLQDLLACKQGHTVMSLLIDANAFYCYDNRESLMLSNDNDGGDDGY